MTPASAKFDPYAELGVPRDADDSAIKSGYRRRAKETHPDAKGGSKDAFQRTRTALVILSDSARRERFDATGAIEDEKPDNVRAAALQVIEMQMAGFINAFGNAKTAEEAAALDPRKMNLPAAIAAAIRREIEAARQGIAAGEVHRKFLADVKDRFRPSNPALGGLEADPVIRSFESQIRRADAHLEQLRQSIECRERAVEIISAYDFRFDAPEPRRGEPSPFGAYFSVG